MCCTECFDDPVIKEYIESNGVTGDCDYCHSSNVKAVNPRDLTDLFEPVAGHAYWTK